MHVVNKFVTVQLTQWRHVTHEDSPDRPGYGDYFTRLGYPLASLMQLASVGTYIQYRYRM